MAKSAVRSTFTKGVLGDVGSFGGLFDLAAMGFADPVLVSSADGVGTKLQAAVLTGRHDTVGRDLVNHCVNDILVQGALPLFFMDYVGTGRLEPEVVAQVIQGCAEGCRSNGCALLGGETAEMPGLYGDGDYDLVGFIVGAAERAGLITGERIQVGDVLLALPSLGLHTNGYSLARKILFEVLGLTVADAFPGLSITVGEALLLGHRSYLEPLRPHLRHPALHGLVHITGGGLTDNVPRVLPSAVDASIDCGSWDVPVLFQVLVDAGKVPWIDAFRTFNMGIGMVLVVAPSAADEMTRELEAEGETVFRIGSIKGGQGRAQLSGGPLD